MIFYALRWSLVLAASFTAAAYLIPDLTEVITRQPRPAAGRPANAGSETAFGSEMKIRAGTDGHFYVRAEVNGIPVQFIVDTGATSVALSPRDAARIGLRPAPHEFTMRAATANGTVRLAPVSLREVRVGSFSAYDVAAAVNQAPMPVSLLGVSLLQRLQSYEVRGQTLHLRW